MKKIILFASFLIVTMPANAQAPSFEWAKNMGGIYSAVISNSIAVDNSGNVFVTGTFDGKADFDPGSGSFFMTTSGATDVFVMKTNSAGGFVWAKQFSGIASQNSTSITTDASGNIYITGDFYGTADFDPGPSVFNLTATGNTDFYIVKLDASGNFLWAKYAGSSLDDYSKSVKTDAAGNVYISGYFKGTVDFDPGVGTYNLTAAGQDDIFILKFNATGNFIWVRKMGGTSADRSNSITVDGSNNIFISGTFAGTSDFDPGAGIYNLTASGDWDLFIVKLDLSGNFLWAKRAGGTLNLTVGYSVAADAAGNIIVTGFFGATTDFNPGTSVFNLTSAGSDDIFLLKLDVNGNFLFAKRIGGTNNDRGAAVTVDGSGNIYSSGYFNGTVDFDPGMATFNQTGNLSTVYVSKLDATGNFILVKSFGGYYSDIGNAITLDVSGNIFTTGVFSDIVDFDPGAGIFNLISQTYTNSAFISKLSASGNFSWAFNIGTSSLTQCKSVDTDLAGNVYVTGKFYGTVDFDPGPNVYNLSAPPDDIAGDIFILKFNTSGNFVWVKQIGGSHEDIGNALELDNSGNIYVTGSFQETVDFDPGTGISNLTAVGFRDIFILKLDPLGNFVWAKNVGSINDDNGFGISTDASGNVYITGDFRGTTADFDPGPGTFNMTPFGAMDIFILKLTSGGNFVWAKQMGGTLIDTGYDIVSDPSGNVYVTGNFASTADFDPGPGIINITASGSQDMFIVKLNASGNYLWANPFGGTLREYGRSIAMDISGNIYTTGFFEGTVDFDPGASTYNLTSSGSTDILVLKLNSAGGFVWAKNMGGVNTDQSNSIQLDDAGNIYTAGFFMTTADFDPGTSTFNLTSSGNYDIFISKLNPSGSFIWAGKAGGSGDDQGNAITVIGTSFYTAGYFNATADFDPGTSTINLAAAGNPDGFILKMSQCTLAAIITPSGPVSFCSPGSVILNANTGTGLTYIWKKNGTTISGATGSSYTATTTGNYTVVVSNSCGTSTSAATTVTVSTAIPNTPGSITTTGGIVKVCPGDIRTYTVTNVSTVISYTWTTCAGSVILSGQNTNSVTIQYNSGFTASDTIRVVANNYCGTSAQRKLKITRNNPATPSAITGDAYGVCNLSGIPYSITNVAGMTYNWNFNTGTATVASGQGTNAITANFGAGYISGTLSVTATNACGTSTPRAKSVYAKPATPASITGATTICANQQDVPYSIAPLSNTVNYTWVGPSGSHISDGVTTSAGATLITTATFVTVDFATTAGSVKVRGNNACASGSYKTLSVAIVCREGEFADELVETRIYPNPAVNSFTVETDDSSSPFDLEVYDAYGRLIYSETNLNSGNQVNADSWSAGLYSVVVRNKNYNTTLKLALTGL